MLASEIPNGYDCMSVQDPSFRYSRDEESNQTVGPAIGGMETVSPLKLEFPRLYFSNTKVVKVVISKLFQQPSLMLMFNPLPCGA